MKKHKDMSFWVLILTINTNIERVKQELLPQLWHIQEIIISHQIFDGKTKPSSFTDKRIVYIPTFEKWVSKNRNIAMKYTKSDIVHICWDDISYVKWFDKTILSAYRQTPDMWIISFQACDPKTLNYIISVSEWNHNFKTILSTKSCGMTYNKTVLNKLWIKFDEQFWLWTDFPTWEETIYFSDFLKKWWKGRHIDMPIVYHSQDTSGSDFTNTKLISSRIQVFHRMFWFAGALFAWVYFGFRDYSKYKKHIMFKKYVALNIQHIFNKGY